MKLRKPPKGELIARLRQAQSTINELTFNFYSFMLATLNQVEGKQIKLDETEVAKLRANYRLAYDKATNMASLIAYTDAKSTNDDTDAEPAPTDEELSRTIEAMHRVVVQDDFQYGLEDVERVENQTRHTVVTEEDLTNSNREDLTSGSDS